MKKPFSAEQKEWMVINCPLLGFKKATFEFNNKFNENRSVDTIKTHCYRNGIKLNKEIRSEISRKNRSKRNNGIYDIGDVFVQKGYKYIKTGKGHKQMLYSRYIWELNYGPVPENYSVIYLNGDSMDCDIDNLMAISNRIKSLLSVYDLWSNNADIMRTSIKWCELRLNLLDNGVLDNLYEEEKKSKYYDGVDLGAIQQKVQSKSKSGVKGVTWDNSRNKWRAHIEFKGKAYHLGRFDKLDDAIKARKEAEEKYFIPIIEASKCKGG